jgi:UDP-glucuronate 4-epimerase
MAVHKFIRLVDSGEPIPLYGDGSSSRDYTYVSDLLDGIISALTRKFDFEIFNLGNSETTTLSRLVAMIEENLGKKADIERLPAQAGDVPTTCADVSKSQRLLDYRPKVGVQEGIQEFIRWYKTQGNSRGPLDCYPLIQ